MHADYISVMTFVLLVELLPIALWSVIGMWLCGMVGNTLFFAGSLELQSLMNCPVCSCFPLSGLL